MLQSRHTQETQEPQTRTGRGDAGFATTSLHQGYAPNQHIDASAVPIYATAAYDLWNTDRGYRVANGKEPGAHLYSRAANPTTDVLESRLAALDGGVAAVAFGSGMGALSSALLNLADHGGRIVTTRDLYGGTFDLLSDLLPAFGVGVDYVDKLDDAAELASAIGHDTRAVFAETVSNPTNRIVDLDTVSSVAHGKGVAVIVDNTLPTPYLYRPIEHGADVVVYSTTKSINGHGTAVGGAVVDAGNLDYGPANAVEGHPRFPQFNEPQHTLRDEDGNALTFAQAAGSKAFSQRLRGKYLRLLGAAPGPFESFLTIQGLETLEVRLDREVASTERIAAWLESHDHVVRVNYAGLPSHPDHALADRDFPRGVGTVLSFDLEGSQEQLDAFIDATTVFTYLTNIGDAKSLIVNPSRTTHREFDPGHQRSIGVTPTTVRLSIGLEEADDLIADLERGFAAAYGD